VGISYDPGANCITVVGYSEDAPCTFEDIYQADKAGTLTLINRDGITGVDTDPVDNSYPLRPADEMVMGGAKHDLWVTIENWSGFTDATIRLIGKDEAGNDQTEDIVVTGNGTYYSDELWTELTQTQVVGVNGSGSFDYSVVQGQWGVVSKQNDNQYEFRCKLTIAHKGIETWLIDTNKMVYEDVGMFLEIRKNGHVRFGKVIDSEKKMTSGGCFIHAKKQNTYIVHVFQYASLELYSTTLSAGGRVFFGTAPNCQTKIWNCNFEHIDFSGNPVQMDVYRLYFVHSHYGLRGIFTTAEDIRLAKVDYATTWINQHEPIVMKKIVTDKEEQNSFYLASSTADLYFIDTDWKWVGAFWDASSKVYRQYTFNLKVVDKAENPIPNASVKIWDKNNTLVVDETTDANGEIPEQTLTYGYFDQDHWDTPVMQTPHTLLIAAPGFESYRLSFVIDRPTVWKVKLSRKPVCVDQEVMI